MSDFNLAATVSWLNNAADVMEQQKAYLTDLDAAIGDSDHGQNMARGFQAVKAKIAGQTFPDIGALFKTVAMTLISTVGGAAGPLYGTLFLQAATKANGKQELSTAEWAECLDAGIAGVVMRGKAELEDKTMIDALTPALEALRNHASDNLATALAASAEGAEAGMKATIPLVARKGRASYLGERSANHQDPGATSTWMLLKSLADTLAA